MELRRRGHNEKSTHVTKSRLGLEIAIREVVAVARIEEVEAEGVVGGGAAAVGGPV